METNKVIYDGDVLIDLTGDTVTADNLEEGYTCHTADGTQVVGTLVRRLRIPDEFDFIPGYTSGGAWIWEDSTNNRTDIYEVRAGRRYILSLGETVGTRFRAGYAETDPRTISSGRITGTQVINTSNPAKNASIQFTSTIDGYLYVTKDNTGVSDLRSYLLDITLE